MTEDELYVSDLRPEGIFGSLGAADEFEEEEEYEYEDVPIEGQASPATDRVGYPAQNAALATQANPSTGAAFTLFTLVGGAVLGGYFGGVKGAAGGLLVAAGVRNIFRAKSNLTPGSQHLSDGVKQGVIGTVVAGGGAYLLWTGTKK